MSKRTELGSALENSRHRLTMVVPSTREMVSVIRAALAEVLRKAGFSATDIEDIKLAVNEACTNILAHAYKWRQDGVLILRLSIQPERLMIRIRDFGAKAPPESFKSRDLDNLAPSGVGIFLMKELMDEVHYDHSHAVGTELILVKERPRADKLKL